ncbi:MAG: glycosyltransferase family 2 protein [Rhodobacteraceae bacterium]|nr:glycosyltransferase family 2 protein [Paracoccaceae bacterium]
MTKAISALTMVRNDAVFIRKWVDYYGNALGRKNLFIILDGHDQEMPAGCEDVNAVFLPKVHAKLVRSDRRRAKVMSHFAAGLLYHYDMVIGVDIDEFIVVDPALAQTLPEYLSTLPLRSSWSPLGLDVGQHISTEAPADFSKPLLSQRKYAMLSSRYTKPSIIMKPVRWGSGMHRIKGRNFKIDPNLYLFHFGMVDQKQSQTRENDADLLKAGWGNHMKRRGNLLNIIEKATPLEGDSYFSTARKLQQNKRPLYALNKPKMIKGDPVVRIPERFATVV